MSAYHGPEVSRSIASAHSQRHNLLLDMHLENQTKERLDHASEKMENA